MIELTLEEQEILEHLLDSRLIAIRRLLKDSIDANYADNVVTVIESELDQLITLSSKVVLYAP